MQDCLSFAEAPRRGIQRVSLETIAAIFQYSEPSPLNLLKSAISKFANPPSFRFKCVERRAAAFAKCEQNAIHCQKSGFCYPLYISTQSWQYSHNIRHGY